MNKTIFVAAGAFLLGACGDTAALQDDLQNRAGAAIDEAGLANAVDQAIDRDALGNAVKGAAIGAAQEAVRETVPPEVAAIGSVVDEKALANAVDAAVDEKALGNAVAGAVEDARANR